MRENNLIQVTNESKSVLANTSEVIYNTSSPISD